MIRHSRESRNLDVAIKAKNANHASLFAIFIIRRWILLANTPIFIPVILTIKGPLFLH
jgi:hypothetical protein